MAAVGRLAPPIVLMGLIFALSAQPHLATDLGVWDTIARKLAHMAAYGLLWWLWWRALRWRLPALAVAITLLYAASDEWHQAGVEGRHGSAWDVAIDAAGVGLAGLAVTARRRGRERALSASASRS
jgi:VanZ family protein